ncbi:MAG: hypothetical protein JWM44_1714 [Bacilli bacterium]|nr:hypothetical protein [Bacilli bacterium]
MVLLSMTKWSFDPDLQIIHADVKLLMDGQEIINEPLCVDVGMPALLLSAHETTMPNRWADAEQWQSMPFFVCGCGDAECRAFSFVVNHIDHEWIQISEVDERLNDHYRVAGEYIVSLAEYRNQVQIIAKQFLQYVRDLDYRPFFKDTVIVVKMLLNALEEAE